MSGKAKKKILFLSPYPVGKAPSQRLKFEQYYGVFEEEGYEITTSSFISRKFYEIIYKPGNLFRKMFFVIGGYLRRFRDLFRVHRYDVVYVHLWVAPLGIPFFEFIVTLLAKRLVYDIDDMIFLGHVSKANRWSFFLKGKAKASYLMKKADHVITCTPVLDEYAKQFNRNTTDISSTIDTLKYKARAAYPEKEELVLGWSGSHSTSGYLHLLDGVLKELAQERKFRLRVIGDPDFSIPGVKVEALSWREETETDDLSIIDIGLYPLPDEPWVYGKSGLKALQYMALGIPVAATAIGANFRIIENEQNGLLISGREEWKNKLKALIDRRDLRENLGRAGRKTVEERFSLEANKAKYLQVLESMRT